MRTICHCEPTAGLTNEESASCDLLQLPRRYGPKSSPERVAVGIWGRRLKQKMERTPSEIVKEAAEEDSKASVEVSGRGGMGDGALSDVSNIPFVEHSRVLAV